MKSKVRHPHFLHHGPLTRNVENIKNRVPWILSPCPSVIKFLQDLRKIYLFTVETSKVLDNDR